MKVSKSFKNAINSQQKSGKSLRDSKVLDHKDFGPYVETLARNSPEWGGLRQHEWVFSNAEEAGETVNVFFRHVGDGTTRGLSFHQDRVMGDLYKAETDEPEGKPEVSDGGAKPPTESKTTSSKPAESKGNAAKADN